jgi:hypothetical protein
LEPHTQLLFFPRKGTIMKASRLFAVAVLLSSLVFISAVAQTPPLGPTLQFDVPNYFTSEPSVSAVITVTLSGDLGGKTVTVDHATSDGTAPAPADYASTSGTLSFAPGVTTQTFTVTVYKDLQA